MKASTKDWLFIAKRIPQVAWAGFVGTMRDFTPVLLVASAVCGAHLLGVYGANHWWLVLPIAVGGFGLGTGQDRAEARAATQWAEKFWSLIQTDHALEITVTHKTAPADV